MNKAKLLLLTILIPYLNLTAQQLTDSIANHLILPGSEIPGNRYFEIESDSKSNIYAVSKIGLTKWDGNKWHQYKFYDQLGQHSLKRIAIDNSDGVWVVSEGQTLLKFDDNSLKAIDMKIGCYDMMALDSFMYASSYKNIIKINTVTLEFETINNNLDATALQLQLDNQGNIWGTCMFEDRVFQLQNDSVILHTQLNGISAADIMFIAIIDTSYYALITKTYPYYKLYSNGVYIDIPPPITGDYYVEDFHFLPDSTLSLAYTDGSFIYKNGIWEKLGNTQARAICSISNDSIAIAYEYDGISMGTYNSLTNYKGAGLDEIYTLEYYNNTLFLGSRNGYVSQWNGSELTTAGTIDPLFYNSEHLTISPDNKLYSSGTNGVYCYANKQWESLTKLYNLPNDKKYYKCDISPDNKLYVTSIKDGLYIADSTGVIEHYHSGNSPIFGYMGGILYDSQDRLWFGFGNTTMKGELYSIEDNEFIRHEVTDYFSIGYPSSFLEDSKGNIWVGYTGTEDTNSSLARYNGTQWDTIRYEENLYSLGNSSQPILDIYEDYKGNIWLASFKAYMYDGTTWHRFDKEGGLSQGSTIVRSVTGDGKGNIFMGTQDLGTYVLTYYNGIIEPKARKLQELTIYPNPTADEVHLKLKNGGESTIKVFNTQGSLVFSTKANNINTTLNLSHLTNGQYIINVVQNDYFSSSTIVINK